MSENSGSDSPYEFAPREPVKPVEPPAPDTPVIEELVIERTCPHCGFRIVGKPRGGRCPECAAALDQVATDLLQFSDHDWLLGASNGVLLLSGSILLQLVAVIGGWLGKWPSGEGAIHLVAAATAAMGVWWMTAPEPGVGLARTPYAVAARLAALTVAILWAASLLTRTRVLADAKPEMLQIVIFIAVAIESSLVALHLRTLEMRVPNDSLSAQLINVAFIVPGLCGIMLLIHLLGIVQTERLIWFFCVPLLGLIAGVLVWALWTLFKTGLDLRHCAVAGRTIIARQRMRAEAANAPRPERAG